VVQFIALQEKKEMKTKIVVAALVAACGLALVAGSRTLADSTTSSDQPAAGAEGMQLPPGWTAEDMQAMMAAGTPGENHERLAQDVGEWTTKSQMWMQPGTEPMTCECTATVKPIMDGRYVEVAMKGEMPGMGEFKGVGIYGFDNVSQKFVSVWLDNHSTGIMNGTGEASDDGKTITWNYTGNCPITKKPIQIKDVETVTGPGTKVIESFAPDRKTGEVYKMMRIEMTKN
jgi:hypothetical protein